MKTSDDLLDIFNRCIAVEELDSYDHAIIEPAKELLYFIRGQGFLNLTADLHIPSGFNLELLTPCFFESLRALENKNIHAGATYCDILHAPFARILTYEAGLADTKFAKRIHNGESGKILGESLLLYEAIDSFLDSLAIQMGSSELDFVTEPNSLEYLKTTALSKDLLLGNPLSKSLYRYDSVHLNEYFGKTIYFNTNNRTSNTTLTDVIADIYYLNVSKAFETLMPETEGHSMREHAPLLKNAVSNWDNYSKAQKKNIYTRIISLIKFSHVDNLINSHFDYFITPNTSNEFKELCARTITTHGLGINIRAPEVIEMNLLVDNVISLTLPRELVV